MAIRDPGVLDRQKYQLHSKTLPQIPTGIFFETLKLKKVQPRLDGFGYELVTFTCSVLLLPKQPSFHLG